MMKIALGCLVLLFIISPASAQLADIVPSISLQGKSYFTESQRKKVEMLRIPMEEVQFYIDGDIYAEREVPVSEQSTIDINNGRIDIREGKMIEFIKFGKNEKCGVEIAEDGKLLMRFGLGENEVIYFKRTAPNVKYDKNQYYEIVVGKDGYLEYANRRWKVLSGKTVKLEFKDTFKSKTKKKVNRVKGYKVGN